MFVREHQNQFRGAQADVKTFYGNVGTTSFFSWNKPVGTTFVYIMLIGGGGAGDNTSAGGGTGAITVWFGSAKNIPNYLLIRLTPSTSSILFRSSTALITMMSANAAGTSIGGAAQTVNGYYSAGFYNFTAGAAGSTAPTASPSTTTFLLPGAASGTPGTGNYGYTAAENGYFLLSPIIVSLSGNVTTRAAVAASYGSGANINNINSSPGMAIIASW